MRKRALLLSLVFLFISIAYAQTAGDYLILQDIGRYKLTKGFLFRGRIVGAEPKMSRAGDDVSGYYTSYETSYAGGEGYSAPKVEVSIYESTQWLLHEVEDTFRKNPEQDNFRGVIREINGNRIFTYRRGTHYSWISNNIVVDIRYTDLQKTKPEPLEIVSAYLQKHPSTIPVMVMDKVHDEIWIKDEMERRLWLCDKWIMQYDAGKTDLNTTIQTVVKHMEVFLNYREKYYGMKAYDEKVALLNYKSQNDLTSIKNKLTEYKNWWSVNKGKAIIL